MVTQFSEYVPMTGVAEAGDNSVARGNETIVEPPRFQPNPEDVLIEIKQEEEPVIASAAAVTLLEPNEILEDASAPEDDELGTPAVDDAAEMTGQHLDNDMGGCTGIISLGSPPEFIGSGTNTFAAPARPSRKVKKYPCDVCGQIFTRSGDVKRHKESRHKESAGCICPYCGRVLTRYVPSFFQSPIYSVNVPIDVQTRRTTAPLG
jgi:DNA-directed RNA polymerase subunit RPC12/RpoP